MKKMAKIDLSNDELLLINNMLGFHAGENQGDMEVVARKGLLIKRAIENGIGKNLFQKIQYDTVGAMFNVMAPPKLPEPVNNKWVAILKRLANPLLKRRCLNSTKIKPTKFGDPICITRNDNGFEIQILNNSEGGYTLYFLSNNRPSAVILTKDGGIRGNFEKGMKMPCELHPPPSQH